MGNLAVAMAGLPVAMVLSRYLPVTDYGSYRQVWLVYNTLFPLFILGLPMSINYFIAGKQKPEQKAYQTQTYILLAVSGVVLSVLFFLLSFFIEQWFSNPNLKIFFQIFAFIPLLTLPTLHHQNLLICLDKTKLAAGLGILVSFLKVVFICIPVIYGASLETVFWCLVIFSIVQLVVITYVVFAPFISLKSNWDRAFLSRQLVYAVPLGLSSLIGALTRQLDKLNIASFFTSDEFAVYVNGAFEVPLVGIITGSATAVLMPVFVKNFRSGEISAFVQTWHSAIRKVALIILPCMVFLLIYADEFVVLLFSAKYAESAGIFRIYLLALPNRITTFGMVLLSMGLSKAILHYSAYTMVLNLSLNILLIFIIGFNGPAIATVVTIYLIGFLQLVRIRKEINTSMRAIFPWRVLLRILVVCAGAGVVVLPVKLFLFLDSAITALIVGSLTFLLSFSLLGLSAKMITKNEIVEGYQSLARTFHK